MADADKIWFYFETNGWRHVLEIFILVVLIYYAFRFVRGTRGWPVVIGFVVILLALALATTLLKLEVLRWILGSASLFIVVGALVIFQPELRRMLAELGNLQLFATASEQRESIEVVIQTCERLAEVKIGALIAIEQSIQLQEAVESGIQVDCDATPEMLETIFFPNNAIHDGGVILKGDRIAYAACIFPLTQRADLNKSLGTRHRAAIGLSEETDAVIVAVSEETGMISYAYKGQLTRGVTLEELRAFLTSVILRPTKSHGVVKWLRAQLAEGNRASGPAVITKNEPRPVARPAANNFHALHDFFFKDVGWKFFSLLLAAGIWLTVHRILQESAGPEPHATGSQVTYGNLPVFIVASASDVHLYRVAPDTISVTVSGAPDAIAVLQANQIRATVDLTDIESAGDLKRRVDISVPSGITLVSVEPPKVGVIIPPLPMKKP